MSMIAKVSCRNKCLTMAFGCIWKYLKDILSLKTFVFCNLKWCYHVLKQLITTNNCLLWVGHLNWAFANFLFSNVIGCLFCIKTIPIGNPLVLVCTSNNLEIFENNTWIDKSLYFNSSNIFCYSLCQPNDNSSLKRFVNSLPMSKIPL